MYGVETVTLAEKVGWSFGRATDSTHLGDALGRDTVLPRCLDDDIGNLVMAASGTQ
jgi:hypothetical protein